MFRIFLKNVMFGHLPKGHIDLKRILLRCSSSCDSGSFSSNNHEPPLNPPSIESHGFRTTSFKTIHIDKGNLLKQVLAKPDQPLNAKCLKVAVIGAPNSGKSTLTNSILGWRVSSVSSKVHTTRSTINGVWTENETQIVFLDTPGITDPRKRKRHNLDKKLLSDPQSSIFEADLIAVVVDASKPWSREKLDREILKALHLNKDKKSILILNKVDLVDKEKLLHPVRTLTEGIIDGQRDSDIIRKRNLPKLSELLNKPEMHALVMKHSIKKELKDDDTGVISKNKLDVKNSKSKKEYNLKELPETNATNDISNSMDKNKSVDIQDTDSSWQDHYSQMRKLKNSIHDRVGWDGFSSVFMISAHDGDGVDDLKDYLLYSAKKGDWAYHSSLITDEDPTQIAIHCVWEKFLDHLPQEVPYQIGLNVVYWEPDEDGLLRIVIEVNCYNSRHLRLVLGKGGSMITKISKLAKTDLMNTFRCDLTLGLVAKFREKKK